MLGLALVGLAASLVAFATYQARHAWFARHGDGAWVFWSCVVIAVALAATIGVFALGRRLWTWQRLVAPLAATVIGACLTTYAWGRSGPTPNVARSALIDGNEARAEFEARAAIDLAVGVLEARAVLDEISLRRLRRTTDVDAAVSGIRGQWFSEDVRGAGLDHVRGLVREAAHSDFERGDQRALETLARSVTEVDRDLATEVAVYARRIQVVDCAGRVECDCVVGGLASLRGSGVAAETVQHATKSVIGALEEQESRALKKGRAEKAPHVRRAELQSAIAAAKCRERVTNAPRQPPIAEMERELARAEAEVRALEKRAAEEAAAAEQRRKVREAQEEAARKAKEAQAGAATQQSQGCGGRLRCNDGTCSPTCACGRASNRGCCSRHGGVAVTNPSALTDVLREVGSDCVRMGYLTTHASVEARAVRRSNEPPLHVRTAARSLARVMPHRVAAGRASVVPWAWPGRRRETP